MMTAYTPFHERVREAAGRFRAAVVTQKYKMSLITFEQFPLGACGDACLLLGRFLQDVGLGDWEYVYGWNGDRSHAWLQSGKVIVDITADQFPGVTDLVIVTEDSGWHNQFKEASREPVDYTFCPCVNPDLETAYRQIIQAIDPQGE
jgi:hypothetical protein